ncbi:MAG: bifunctional ADP-heptose synthase [Flavobacteriales bacterium]|nr:bifunctional ADP-heptose synthase [Flavobacteriales bacterium]
MKINWHNIFNDFAKIKVLIIGDAMIDSYMWGSINRQSPEAPIPIVDVEKHEKRLGGAANVASNIKALGGTPILCSVIGNDDKGFFDLMKAEKLSTEGILQEDRKTTLKTRIISENKHQLRVDEEDTFSISNESDFIQHTKHLMKDVQIVIFQDYNKGVLSKNIISELISSAKKLNIPVLVDPKKDNYWEYKGVDLFKPNSKELTESNSSDNDSLSLDSLAHIVSYQRKQLDAKAFLLTLSEKGVYIQTENESTHYPAFKRNIVDVSGAGDAVIATAALALAKNINFNAIAQLANLAGGLSCESVGVNPLDKDMLLKEASRLI